MISETKRQVLELFNQGRKHYKLMEFDQARQCFEKAVALDPNDGPSKVYAERCRQFVAEPPPEDWDGVYVMKTK